MLADEKIKFQSGDAAHNVIMESRTKLVISGVEEVESFDDVSISAFTTCGLMTVRGRELHIDRLSLETGEMNIRGSIDGIEYIDDVQTAGFWSRLFK